MRRMVFTLCWVTLLASASYSQTRQDVESLRGLQGIIVGIPSYPDELENNGLTKIQMFTEVELRLRRAGIKILSPQEASRVPGMPMLYLNLSAIKAGEGLYVLSLRIELEQFVRLERMPSVSMRCATWQVSNIATVGGH